MQTVITERKGFGKNRGSLEEFLHSQISAGKLRPGDRLSTVNLAKEWNVSEGTVNQSLHILAAKGLLVRKRRAGTFVGNEAGRQQAKTSNNVLAMVLPHLKQPEFSFILQGLQSAAQNSPFVVGAYATDDNAETYAQVLRDQINAGARAIVLVPPLTGVIATPVLIELYNSKIPVVTCFRAIEGFGWPLVRTDFVQNAKTGARHLCELGRKNIGLVTLDAPDSYHHLASEHAVVEVLEEFGLSAKRSMRLSLHGMGVGEEMWLFRAINEVEGWLARNPEIDAVCCLHDLAAWPVLSALRKNGKRVPEDVAIVGNGNVLETLRFGNADLTTVDCCYDDFGKAIFDLINDISEGKPVEFGKKTEIKGKLLVRHSTVGNGSK